MVVPVPTPQPGDEYRSVTNILNAIPKEFLTRWAAKVTAETAVEKLDLLTNLASDDPDAAVSWLKGAPWSKRDKAAEIGTAVHLIAELDATGQSAEAEQIMSSLDPIAQAKARQARNFFSTVDVLIEHVEFVVYNHTHNYAGTGDFIVSLGPDFPTGVPGVDITQADIRVILDLKSGSGVYPEAALQLAAYRYAEEMIDLGNLGLEREDLRRYLARSRTYVYPPAEVPRVAVPDIHAGLVLHVDERSWALIPVDCSLDTFQKFIAASEMSKHVPLDRLMIGTPILRGKA